MDDDDEGIGMGLADLIPEPERPPSPEPSIAVYERPNPLIPPKDVTADDAARWERLKIRLVGSHPLWGHHLWNAARVFAAYLDQNAASLCRGKNVLELGAGGALPSLVAALSGANKVVITDYPDPDLMENIKFNANENLPEPVRKYVAVEGYIWGRNPSSLLDLISDELPPSESEAERSLPPRISQSRGKFDLLILSDLVFNHAMHDALLDTCDQTLRSLSREPDSHPGLTTPVVLVFYTHHRPHLADKDLDFFTKARAREWICEEIVTERAGVMFPEDPGDEEVRSTVHGWRMHRPVP